MRSSSCALNASYCQLVQGVFLRFPEEKTIPFTMSTHPAPAIYELGPDFFDAVKPATFPAPQLRYRNETAAELLGLHLLSKEQWQEHFCAFKALPGNLSEPLALRYHGHQFQSYNPDLGDGRGFLFAQFQTDEKLLDLGTKGSGTTPYSRRGDGRLTLKGAFREILATEMLESLGVNTSKTFSVFETGESLERHDEPSPTRAAVLVRMNHSHIRFGTFQRLAFFKQTDNIKKLLGYCIKHFYPELQGYEENEQAVLFLKAVGHRTAKLAASWMIAGFVHGVLNTDNMNITGESFDYGPYRFLPHYDPKFTAAYFDHSGLYSFGRQPASVLWNLYQLGGALQVAFKDLPIEETLEDFGDIFTAEIHQRVLKRLNLRNPLEEPAAQAELNTELVTSLFQFMSAEKTFYEQTYFDLHSGVDETRLQNSPFAKSYTTEIFNPLKTCLESYEIDNESLKDHAYFKNEKPCSLLIDELEALWAPIANHDDWSLLQNKLKQIRSFRGVY